MPLFEYHCRDCDRPFEVLVTTRSAGEIRCPNCDGVHIDRLIGLPAAGKPSDPAPATNCRGDGPPCGAPWCGRKG